MRKTRMFGVAVALLTLVGAAAGQQYDRAAEQTLVQLANAERAKQGLPSLEIDERLTTIARKHSELMARRGSLSHQLSGEPTVRERVASTGMRFNFSGENVAYDSRGAESAHRGLMNSPHHRENILRQQFNVIGIGAVRQGGILYVTQNFARRLPEVSVNEAEQVIVKSFAELRRSSGAAPLRNIEQPGLRKAACEMAKLDKLSPARVRSFKNVHNVVVWTATELEELPPSLKSLRTAQASGYSVGACLAASKSYPEPVYWVALVTYF